MAVKKTAKAKKTTAKKTGPAKKTAAGRTSARKKSPATKTKNVKKPAGKRGGFHREMNDETGFVVGTDQDAIATALMEGGESRAAIVERLEGELDLETRNGTEKQITNMVSGVLNKMLANGYIVDSSFVVLPPTPASKRKATAAKNAAAKSKPAAKKSPAKKTAAKRPAAKKTAAKGKAASKRKK